MNWIKWLFSPFPPPQTHVESITINPDGNGHFCPGCGGPQKWFERYPWHFCQNCLGVARDGDGHRLEFSNASVTGGLVWRRQGDEDWQDAVTVHCLIQSRPVVISEARFGGIVAQPLLSGPIGDAPNGVLKLTKPSLR